ncbi:MAG: glycosyltransferase family 2 protein [Lachnospiraceae bacterium]|nr:glycosyltransferase family 2 protein [Lachnospiraceae bacterium]
MVKTTVVIPNYNGIKYLEDCLTFLHRSKETVFETIVVDNGSTDGSAELLKSRFPWVKLIALKENTGFSHAVNVGIKESKTPYVLLLNNDTVVEHDFVACLEKAMDENPGYFSFSSKMLSMHEPEVIDDAGDYYCALGWAFARGKGKSAQRFTGKCDVFAACAGAAIYRREIFREIGYFDRLHFAYLEDIDVGYRARLRGYKNGYCPKAVVYHAGSGFSGSRYNEFKVNLSSRNSIYLIYKNMPLLQIVLNFPLLLIGFLVKTLFFIKKGMGYVYVRGLWRGIKLSCSREAAKMKFPFRGKYFWCYVKVQMELWYNLLRRVTEG